MQLIEPMKNTPFVQAVLKTADEKMPELPWARGSRRRRFVAKRKQSNKRLKSA